jgi:hypothetical protein
MTGQNYWPPDIPLEDITRSDKEAMLREDRLRNTSTYFDQQRIASALDADSAKTRSGSQPSSDFRQLPDTSPWGSGYAPEWKPEEQLNYSVDEVPVIVEPHEQLNQSSTLAPKRHPRLFHRAMMRKRMLGGRPGPAQGPVRVVG